MMTHVFRALYLTFGRSASVLADRGIARTVGSRADAFRRSLQPTSRPEPRGVAPERVRRAYSGEHRLPLSRARSHR